MLKRSLLGVAALSAALVGGAASANAQQMSPVHFGVSAGASIPTGSGWGSGEKFWNTGYNVTGLVSLSSPTMPAGLRGEVMYHSFGAKNNTGVDDAHILAGTLNAVVQVPASGLNPYVIGGAGAYNLKAASSDVSDSRTKFGLNGGLGLKFNLSGFSTFAESRFHYVFDKDSDVGRPNLAFVPINFGLVF